MIKKSLLLVSVCSLSLVACAKQQAVSYNAYGVQKGAGSTGVHTVLPGDTVYKIAQNYQLPMREIITVNNMQAPYNLNAGYRLKLPPPNEHIVRDGDSVSSVARLYEVSPNRLVRLNNLIPPYNLVPRTTLRLPSTSNNLQVAAMQNSSAIAEPIESARLSAVERSGIERSPTQGTATNIVTPDIKPAPPRATVQKASASRAKLPRHTPKMSDFSKSGGKFMRPVDGNVISTYGPKSGGLHNDGINIKAVRGSAVRAAENGVVVYTGDDLEGYGNLILVRHENRMMSAYAHLDKTLIKRGAKVKRGQSIGTVGSSGQVDSPQLHFEIRKGTKALDPMKYL